MNIVMYKLRNVRLPNQEAFACGVPQREVYVNGAVSRRRLPLTRYPAQLSISNTTTVILIKRKQQNSDQMTQNGNQRLK